MVQRSDRMSDSFSCADGIAGIAIGELDAFVPHLVDVGSLDRSASITTEIPVSQIINDDEDDIGLGFGLLAHTYVKR